MFQEDITSLAGLDLPLLLSGEIVRRWCASCGSERVTHRVFSVRAWLILVRLPGLVCSWPVDSVGERGLQRRPKCGVQVRLRLPWPGAADQWRPVSAQCGVAGRHEVALLQDRALGRRQQHHARLFVRAACVFRRAIGATEALALTEWVGRFQRLVGTFSSQAPRHLCQLRVPLQKQRDGYVRRWCRHPWRSGAPDLPDRHFRRLFQWYVHDAIGRDRPGRPLTRIPATFQARDPRGVVRALAGPVPVHADNEYQRPTPFTTMSLRIVNVDALLAYNPSFLAGVTNVYIGGVTLSNPRPFAFNITALPF